MADSAIEMALGDGVSAAACRPALIVTGAQPSGHLQSLHLYPLAPSDGTSFGSRQDPTFGSLQTEENGPCVSEGLWGPSTPGHSNWNDEVPPPTSLLPSWLPSLALFQNISEMWCGRTLGSAFLCFVISVYRVLQF